MFVGLQKIHGHHLFYMRRNIHNDAIYIPEWLHVKEQNYTSIIIGYYRIVQRSVSNLFSCKVLCEKCANYFTVSISIYDDKLATSPG